MGGKGGRGCKAAAPQKKHKQLQQRICACTSLQQLLEAVDSAVSLNHVNVATAIHRSAKHAKRQGRNTPGLLEDHRFQRYSISARFF